MLTSLPQPIIFAHRGASAHAPENTLAAFELALAQGADGIELDVKLSRDGHVIVIHDPAVKRTTGAAGRVRDLALSDLQALDAGSFFSDQFRGEKIPTLEQVFEALGKRTFINVELTNYTTPRDHLVESVCMLVKRFALQKRVMFSSFFASNFLKARAYLPDVPCGLLALGGLLGAWARSFGFAFGKYEALHPVSSRCDSAADSACASSSAARPCLDGQRGGGDAPSVQLGCGCHFHGRSAIGGTGESGNKMMRNGDQFSAGKRNVSGSWKGICA